jgi:glycosyltransferase involved in cell wall biosynthesis
MAEPIKKSGPGMRVLFLMFTFPEIGKSFNMYTALVEQFHYNGHQVVVVAPAADGLSTCIRKEKGITVIRVKTLPLRYVHNVIKGISNSLLPYQFARALKKFLPKDRFDTIVLPTPPIMLVDLASKLKPRYNAKVYLVLRDIFPQNAVDLTFMKKGGILHRHFRNKEKKLYAIADQIGCMSHGNIEYLVRHNPSIDRNKLHILENYQILNADYPSRDYNVKKTYGLEGKFVVVFGGNMGKPQKLENVIALAKSCVEYNDVLFLLLGDGVQKKRLESLIVTHGIVNIVVKDTIPKSDYQKLISVCDIGLISLHEDFTIPNIPSKMLDYFNLGVPVLASIDKATDFGQILESADAGLWSYAGDLSRFKQNFLALYTDAELRKRLGENGRKYFENYLTPERAYKTVVDRLAEL